MSNFSVAGGNHAWDDELNYTKKTTPHPPKKDDISPSQTKGNNNKNKIAQVSLEKTQPVEPPVKTPGGGSGSPTFEDADGDGFLYSTELKNFAAEMGFEGNDSEWNQEKFQPTLHFVGSSWGRFFEVSTWGVGGWWGNVSLSFKYNICHRW